MKTAFYSLSFLAFSLLLAACSSFRNQNALGENNSALGKMQPYTEAFIEYEAPASKWLGPQSLLIHLNARAPGAAEITITPDLYAEKLGPPELPQWEVRQPASVSNPHPLSAEAAREKIQQLALMVEAGTGTFTGCLYPVNLKLVRDDGAITLTQGCRGQGGWVTQASDLASQLIQARIGS
jgi:hypothetical protein